MAHEYISNMHMDKSVIGITDFKSEVKFDLRGCLEDVVTPYNEYSHDYVGISGSLN